MPRPRLRNLAIAVIGSGLVLVATFLIGAYVGAYQSFLMDSSAQANLLAAELRAIRGGTAEKLLGRKEGELDAAIVRALRFQDSGQPWIFWPVARSFQHDRYLRAVAEYRREHPSPGIPKEPMVDAEYRRMADAYSAEVVERNAQLLQRYAK